MNQLVIKLVLKRFEDNVESPPVIFQYIQHCFWKLSDDDCLLCSKEHLLQLDGPGPGSNILFNRKTGPGIKRRRITFGVEEAGGAREVEAGTPGSNIVRTDTNVVNFSVAINDHTPAALINTWSAPLDPSQYVLDDEGQKDLSKLMLSHDSSSTLNTPEIDNPSPFSWPTDDTIMTDSANPKQTLSENVAEKRGDCRNKIDLRALIVKSLFGNDMEAQQVFGLIPSRENYGPKDKIRIFLEHCPYFFHIFFLLMVLFYMFPVTFHQIAMILVAIIVALVWTVYENLSN